MKLQEIIPDVMEPQRHELLRTYVQENISEFEEVYRGRPVKNQVGAISVCEAFWLYCLVRDLSPRLIIESGTLFGFSLWFIEAAVQGNAEIHSFDPGEHQAENTSPHVRYHKCDWVDFFHPVKLPKSSLVFFDDHQDQGRRLDEALAREVGHAVFHDNYESCRHSHVPLRFSSAGLYEDSHIHIFDCLREDVSPLFAVGENAQTYRWLTWVKLRMIGV